MTPRSSARLSLASLSVPSMSSFSWAMRRARIAASRSAPSGLPLQQAVYLHGKPGEITWVEPTYHAVHTTLTHPAYAGAYVYGGTRRRSAPLTATKADGLTKK